MRNLGFSIRKVIGVATVAFCLTCPSEALAAPGDVTLLTYPNSTSTVGRAINGAGDVAGYYDVGSAFRRSAAGAFQPLTYPIYTEPQPRTYPDPPIIAVGLGDAISDNGIVAGLWGDRALGIYRTFVNVAGAHTAIPKPANYWTYQTSGVNNSGVVVGSMEHDVNETGRAWRWTGSGQVQDLGTLGGTQSFGLGINNAGVIVGAAERVGGVQHAYRWTESGGMQSIHALGQSSQANDINDTGVIVGSYAVSSINDRAFRWSPEGGMQTLAMLPGHVSATATFVNEGGWIIGEQWNAQFQTTHVLWTPGGQVIDLLAWVKQVNPTEGSKLNFISSLRGMSDDNLVLGNADDRAFLISVPEPSALALVTTVSMALLRRRRVAATSNKASTR